MTAFNYMYNQLTASSMEDYLLNASFLLGNQSQQGQFPVSYTTNCGSMTTSSNNSSSNSCIDDFDYMNPLLSNDMFTPASTVVYGDGLSSSFSYSVMDDEAMSYFFLPTPAPTVCSGLYYDEFPIKMEYDEVNCPSPLQQQQQQQLQPQDMSFFEKDCFGQEQHFPNSPESMYTTDSYHVTIKQEPSTATEQAQPKEEAQSQAKMPKESAASTTKAASAASTTTNTNTTVPRPKNFACTHCNRTFARKYDAARHKRIHTGVKPYYCPCCKKGFARSDARVRHFRTEYNCRDGANKVQQNRQRNHNQRCTAPTPNTLSHS
ncbi:hypothetical protein V8B55DRAFT_1523808 [Mucor lusitanicus]|nr:hypothetical protein FB192DRAFT_1392483 [Mucor lusitanicus]